MGLFALRKLDRTTNAQSLLIVTQMQNCLVSLTDKEQRPRYSHMLLIHSTYASRGHNRIRELNIILFTECTKTSTYSFKGVRFTFFRLFSSCLILFHTHMLIIHSTYVSRGHNRIRELNIILLKECTTTSHYLFKEVRFIFSASSLRISLV